MSSSEVDMQRNKSKKDVQQDMPVTDMVGECSLTGNFSSDAQQDKPGPNVQQDKPYSNMQQDKPHSNTQHNIQVTDMQHDIPVTDMQHDIPVTGIQLNTSDMFSECSLTSNGSSDMQQDKPYSNMQSKTLEEGVQCDKPMTRVQNEMSMTDMQIGTSEMGILSQCNLIGNVASEQAMPVGQPNAPHVVENARGNTSWTAGAFLLLNAALGVGLLNYPYAYSQAGGVYISTFIQLIVVALSFYSMIILIYCSELTNSSTYQKVMYSMCGRGAEYLAVFSVLFTCYGICIALTVVMRDQYDRLFLSLYGESYCTNWYTNRKLAVSVTALIAILPMCYLQNLDFLKFSSALAFISMVYVVVLNIYKYYTVNEKHGEIVTSPEDSLDLLVMIPVFAFAYQTHEIIIPVYVGMKNKTVKTFSKSIALALLLLLLSYCLAGIYGYLTFGSNVTPDIMYVYDPKDGVVLVAIISLIMNVITTYPLLLICGRGVVEDLYAEVFHLQAPQLITYELRRRIILTSLWFVTTILIALFAPDIEIVLKLLGCLASLNVYILPGFCTMSLGFKQSKRLRTWKSRSLFAVACVLILFGALVFFLVLLEITFRGVSIPEHENSTVVCGKSIYLPL